MLKTILSKNKVIAVIIFLNLFLWGIGFYFYYSYINESEELQTRRRCNLNKIEESLLNKPFPVSNLQGINSEGIERILGKGSIDLIVFNTFCPACRDEMLTINKDFKANRANQNLTIVGVTSEPLADVENYVNKENIKSPIIIDKNGDIMPGAGVTCVPTYFHLNDGIVTNVSVGKLKSANTWRNLIND